MSPALQAVVAVCCLVLTAGLAALLLALRRLAVRAESVLGMLEEELRPLVGEIRQMGEELRRLIRDAHLGLEQVSLLTERATAILGGLGGIVSGVSGVLGALAGVTRAGQLVSLAIGIKRGVDVFVDRLRKGQGDHHGK